MLSKEDKWGRGSIVYGETEKMPPMTENEKQRWAEFKKEMIIKIDDNNRYLDI